MKQIGLFFGSFNPIHIGHLALANYMVEFETIEEVWFVVSPQNPFKQKNDLLDTKLRIKMVELATTGQPAYRAEDIELSLPIPSYSIDSLKALEEKYPDCQFTLIMGADNILRFHHWKCYEEIAAKYPVLVYPRPNFKPDNSTIPPRCKITKAPLIEVSSSEIRQWIKDGKAAPYLLPQKVYQFIKQHGLYQE